MSKIGLNDPSTYVRHREELYEMAAADNQDAQQYMRHIRELEKGFFGAGSHVSKTISIAQLDQNGRVRLDKNGEILMTQVALNKSTAHYYMDDIVATVRARSSKAHKATPGSSTSANSWGTWFSNAGSALWGGVKSMGKAMFCSTDEEGRTQFSLGKTALTVGLVAGMVFALPLLAPACAAIGAALGSAAIGAAVGTAATTALNVGFFAVGVKAAFDGWSKYKEETTRYGGDYCHELASKHLGDVFVNSALSLIGLKGAFGSAKEGLSSFKLLGSKSSHFNNVTAMIMEGTGVADDAGFIAKTWGALYGSVRNGLRNGKAIKAEFHSAFKNAMSEVGTTSSVASASSSASSSATSGKTYHQRKQTLSKAKAELTKQIDDLEGMTSRTAQQDVELAQAKLNRHDIELRETLHKNGLSESLIDDGPAAVEEAIRLKRKALSKDVRKRRHWLQKREAELKIKEAEKAKSVAEDSFPDDITLDSISRTWRGALRQTWQRMKDPLNRADKLGNIKVRQDAPVRVRIKKGNTTIDAHITKLSKNLDGKDLYLINGRLATLDDAGTAFSFKSVKDLKNEALKVTVEEGFVGKDLFSGTNAEASGLSVGYDASKKQLVAYKPVSNADDAVNQAEMFSPDYSPTPIKDGSYLSFNVGGRTIGGQIRMLSDGQIKVITQPANWFNWMRGNGSFRLFNKSVKLDPKTFHSFDGLKHRHNLGIEIKGLEAKVTKHKQAIETWEQSKAGTSHGELKKLAQKLDELERTRDGLSDTLAQAEIAAQGGSSRSSVNAALSTPGSGGSWWNVFDFFGKPGKGTITRSVAGYQLAKQKGHDWVDEHNPQELDAIKQDIQSSFDALTGDPSALPSAMSLAGTGYGGVPGGLGYGGQGAPAPRMIWGSTAGRSSYRKM